MIGSVVMLLVVDIDGAGGGTVPVTAVAAVFAVATYCGIYKLEKRS